MRCTDLWSGRGVCSARTLGPVVARPLLMVLALLGFLTGCGSSTGGRLAISGRVTFRGSPLNEGTIEFVSTDGNRQSGAAIVKGDYSIPAAKGLPAGKYTVRISAVQEAGAAVQGPPGPESMTQKAQDLIPPEYNAQTTLTAEVKAGERNSFTFNLK